MSKKKASKIRKWFSQLHPLVQAALITGVCFISAAIINGLFSRIASSANKPTKPLLTQSERFMIYPNYSPTGYMGDTGDISVGGETTLIRNGDGTILEVWVTKFKYEPKATGPYEWEYKYSAPGQPARFAGVMFQNPANNHGDEPNGGYDLRGFNRIKWEARTVSAEEDDKVEKEANVEFVAGGTRWKWDQDKEEKVSVKFGDSLPPISMGTKHLTNEWREFEYVFKENHIKDSQLRRIVAAFGWVCSWGSNGIGSVRDEEGNITPDISRIFKFEIKNIRYEE